MGVIFVSIIMENDSKTNPIEIWKYLQVLKISPVPYTKSSNVAI